MNDVIVKSINLDQDSLEGIIKDIRVRIMETNKHTIHRNKRSAPNEFVNTVDCNFCNHYVSAVIQIPNTKLHICKTCLGQLSDAIDKLTRDSFEPDFIESRKESV